jgi:hypothetical protein
MAKLNKELIRTYSSIIEKKELELKGFKWYQFKKKKAATEYIEYYCGKMYALYEN